LDCFRSFKAHDGKGRKGGFFGLDVQPFSAPRQSPKGIRMLTWLFYGSVACLSAGALLPAFGGGRNSRMASYAAVVLGCGLLFAYSSVALFAGGKAPLGSFWMAPGVGFSISVDRLSAFFLVIISSVSVAVGIYSAEYGEHGRHEARKGATASLMSLFILSMALVVSSSNTLSFLFFWELMSLSSFLLVLSEYETEESRKAGTFYFVMTQLGAAFLFAAFIILHQASGSFDIRQSQHLGPAATDVVLACLFIGFGMKAGVIPFHKWLPYAHPASPSNVSALMSGVMLKVALYGLIRFMLYVVTPNLAWSLAILLFGTVTAVLGVIYALKEHDIKRLLAYHSIENIGIILIGFGAFLVFRIHGLYGLALVGLLGALLHCLNHAVFKSLLFMAAGSVVSSAGTRNIEEMGGLLKRMPHTGLLFFVGAASISALPPLNGFVSELMIFQALMQSYMLDDPLVQLLLTFCLAAFALTSALAAACFVKAFGITFLAVPRSEGARKAREVGPLMLAGPGLMAVGCVFLGVFPAVLMSWAGFGVPLPDMFAVGAVLAAMYATVFLAVWATSSRKTRVSETWGCGIVSQDSRMEYTASGFSEPIMRIFQPIYRTREDGERRFFDRYGSVFMEGRAEIHLVKFFEQYIYMPVASAVWAVSERVARLQNGHLDSYLSYAFVTILALLVMIGWFV
jgi:hydrogenase-4 component B